MHCNGSFQKKTKLEKSIEDFKAALDKKKDRPSAFNNLGLSLFENGDFEESLHQYGEAIRLEPSAVHYNNRGLAFYHSDRPDEAMEDFSIAL